MDLQGRRLRRCFWYLHHGFASLLILFLCLHQHHSSRVHSLLSRNSSTKEHRTQRVLLSSTQPESPTILNPLTKRMISLTGKVYQDFLRQGQWVQYQGTLLPLDVDLLGKYQQQGDYCNWEEEVSHYQTTSATIHTEDMWYPIAPQLITATTATSSSLQQPQEDDLLFVHKPSGLHCVPPRDVSQPSLSTMVAKRYGNKAKPCHRLDRDTSGLVVFGLTHPAHAAVAQQFAQRALLSKTYVALVAGHVHADEGRVELPIGKVQTIHGFHRWATAGELIRPREAITQYTVQERFTSCNSGATWTRVALTPLTGRGHQLRLHMKALGHPLLGDTLHAPPAVAYCVPRLCLHAQRLQVEGGNGRRLEAISVAPF